MVYLRPIFFSSIVFIESNSTLETYKFGQIDHFWPKSTFEMTFSQRKHFQPFFLEKAFLSKKEILFPRRMTSNPHKDLGQMWLSLRPQKFRANNWLMRILYKTNPENIEHEISTHPGENFSESWKVWRVRFFSKNDHVSICKFEFLSI